MWSVTNSDPGGRPLRPLPLKEPSYGSAPELCWPSAEPRVVHPTLGSQDLHVQVSQAAGRRQRQLDHPLDGDGVAVQVVEQRAVLVVVRHQPQLGPRAVVLATGGRGGKGNQNSADES